jgi:hypothetical protein
LGIVLLLACLGVFLPAPAHAQPPHHPINVSLFFPVSTNFNPTVSTNFRLNILYGRVGSVRGVDLNGLVARTDGDERGVQVTGLHSYVGGELRGLAVTGLLSYVGSRGRGLQVSGLVNFDRGRFSGVQYAGLFNFVDGPFRGIQLTSVYNLNNSDSRWVQIASIVNASGGSFTGMQLTGGVNFTNDHMHGLQIGLADFADTFHGAQVGVANFTREGRGAMIGALNVARRLDGVAVGAVNWADNGSKEWVSFVSSLAAFNTGLQTSIRGFYSMLTAGVGDLKDERSDTPFLSWHYGYSFGLTKRWGLDADLGFVHIMSQPTDDVGKNGKLHYALQARLLAEVRWSRVRLFGGGGVSTVFSEYSRDATTETDPLFVLGITL